MLDPAIVIDQAVSDVVDGGGGGGGGGEPKVLWWLDPRNVARRGAVSTLVVEWGIIEFYLFLLEIREEMPPIKGGRFRNLNDWRRTGGVAMFQMGVVGI